MTTKFFDGKKAVDLWGDDPTGWTILTGDQSSTDADYYKFIPTLYRAVQLRAGAVASMPFELRKGKRVFETSGDWQNKVNFLPNPATMLQLVEASLVLTGAAYLFRERNVAMTKALKYHLSSSITPEIDEKTGEVIAFKRPVGGVIKTFKPSDYVYFWQPDPFVEVGTPKNYPAKAAANACGVLLNIDMFSESFFERGAIKAMLLTVKGMPLESERNKLADWWRRVVAGVKNAFGAQVINADSITPVVVGEGIKELENTSINQEKREDISIALGIPMSILFANAANYATSKQDELNFLTKTVIPDCEFIASILNEQLFDALGLQLVFLPETLDPMQEDEAERAVALGQLTNAGLPLLLAMELLGYELTDDQRAMLEKAQAEKEERAEEMAQQIQGGEDEPDDDQDDGEMDEEVKRWQRKALNALKRGKSAAVVFDTTIIPAYICETVTAGLQAAQTPEAVREVFAGVNEYTPESITRSDDIKSLVEAMRLAVEALRLQNDKPTGSTD